jgi:hypothetical protein
MKQIKIFLAIYIPLFIVSAILYQKGIVGPWAGYVLALLITLGIIWVLKHTMFKKK